MASTINSKSTGSGGIITTGDASGQLELQTNDTTAVTIDTSQRVGIGTTSPANLLHVYGSGPLLERTTTATTSVRNTLNLRVNSTGSASDGFGPFIEATLTDAETTGGVLGGIAFVRSGADNTGSIALYTSSAGSNTEKMRISNSGYVGIGSNSPARPLDVAVAASVDTTGATGKWTAGFRDTTAMASGVGGSLLFQGIKSTAGSVGNFAAISGRKENGTDGNESGYLSFYTTPNSTGLITERARFDSNGNFLINTSTASYNNANRGLIEVNGTSTALIALKTGDTQNGYIYATGTDMIYWAEGTRNISMGTAGSGSAVFQTNNAERMRIDSSGRVGIGTNSPSTTMGPGLHIATSSGNSLILEKASGAAMQFRSDASTIRASISGINGADGVTFATGSSQTERVRIDGSGNVCVGSEQPGNAATLNLSVGNPGVTGGGVQLWHTTSGTHYVQFGDSTAGGAPYSGAVGYNHSADALTFWTNQTEKMRITSTGELLIGATSNATTSGVVIKGYAGNNQPYNNNSGAFWSSQGNITLTNAYGTLNIAAGSTKTDTAPYWMAGNLGGNGNGFYINLRSGWNGSSGGGDAPAYRIQYGGTDIAATISRHDWTVGQTSTPSMALINNTPASVVFGNSGTTLYNTEKFLCNTDSTDGPNIVVNCTNTGWVDDAIRIRVARASSTGYNMIMMYNNVAVSAAVCFQTRGDGNTYNTNGVFGTYSDVKLKQDIVDATSQWDDFKSIKFRKFRLKSQVAQDANAPYLLGVVADELEQTSPGLVEITEDRNADTNELTGEVTKVVKTSVMEMKAMKALQEAMIRIEQLEARLAAANL